MCFLLSAYGIGCLSIYKLSRPFIYLICIRKGPRIRQFTLCKSYVNAILNEWQRCRHWPMAECRHSFKISHLRKFIILSWATDWGMLNICLSIFLQWNSCISSGLWGVTQSGLSCWIEETLIILWLFTIMSLLWVTSTVTHLDLIVMEKTHFIDIFESCNLTILVPS